MPFKFTGTLSKVRMVDGADQLTPEKKGDLDHLQRDFAFAAQ